MAKANRSSVLHIQLVKNSYTSINSFGYQPMSGELVESAEVGEYTIELRFVDNDVPPWSDRTMAVKKYSLRIKPTDDPNEGESFPFWDSEHATRNNETAELSGVLSSVLEDAVTIVNEFDGPHSPQFSSGVGSEFVDHFGEFVSHYGYDSNASEGLRAWYEMNRNTQRLLNVVSEGELLELADAARDDNLSSVA